MESTETLGIKEVIGLISFLIASCFIFYFIVKSEAEKLNRWKDARDEKGRLLKDLSIDELYGMIVGRKGNRMDVVMINLRVATRDLHQKTDHLASIAGGTVKELPEGNDDEFKKAIIEFYLNSSS